MQNSAYKKRQENHGPKFTNSTSYIYIHGMIRCICIKYAPQQSTSNTQNGFKSNKKCKGGKDHTANNHDFCCGKTRQSDSIEEASNVIWKWPIKIKQWISVSIPQIRYPSDRQLTI